MKRAAVIGGCLLLAGCGTFHLDNGAVIPVGRTRDQFATDQIICKDKAMTESQTASDQVRGFLLGLTIVGAAVYFDLQKQAQRRVFTECMTGRGYTVIPASD